MGAGAPISGIVGTARAAVAATLDFVLPPRCPACGVIVGDQHSFCAACWASIRFLGEPCCAGCGLPFDFDHGADARCAPCMAEPPPFTRARAVMAYGDVARTVALKFKYGRRTGLATLMAHHMTRHLAGVDLADALFVPVPLHRWRMWSRGFNQAALMATALADLTSAAAMNDALVRIRRTPPLHNMGHRARRRTVAGAFALAPARREDIAGRHIILVDDIWTSGATASACAHVLARAGAVRVDLLCWARVLDADADSRLLPTGD